MLIVFFLQVSGVKLYLSRDVGEIPPLTARMHSLQNPENTFPLNLTTVHSGVQMQCIRCDDFVLLCTHGLCKHCLPGLKTLPGNKRNFKTCPKIVILYSLWPF